MEYKVLYDHQVVSAIEDRGKFKGSYESKRRYIVGALKEVLDKCEEHSKLIYFHTKELMNLVEEENYILGLADMMMLTGKYVFINCDVLSQPMDEKSESKLMKVLKAEAEKYPAYEERLRQEFDDISKMLGQDTNESREVLRRIQELLEIAIEKGMAEGVFIAADIKRNFDVERYINSLR